MKLELNICGVNITESLNGDIIDIMNAQEYEVDDNGNVVNQSDLICTRLDVMIAEDLCSNSECMSKLASRTMLNTTHLLKTVAWC